jgi:hypothetical protein
LPDLERRGSANLTCFERFVSHAAPNCALHVFDPFVVPRAAEPERPWWQHPVALASASTPTWTSMKKYQQGELQMVRTATLFALYDEHLGSGG